MKKLVSILLALMMFSSGVACKKKEETKRTKKTKADEDIEDIEDDDEDEDEDDDDDEDEDETKKTKKTKKTTADDEDDEDEDDDEDDEDDETEATKKTKKTTETDDDEDETEPSETEDTTKDTTKSNSGRTLEDAISPDELKMMNDQAQKQYVQNDPSMKDLTIEVKGNELIYTYYFNQEFDDATAQLMQQAIDTDSNKQMIKNLKGSIEAQYGVSDITITYVYCDSNGKEIAKISA